ncbi:MAG: hypothetical protein K2H64_08420, partial [Desulfovibrio sp.]|nr:hypothetical protein [Desulfovibrio sp.]
MNSYKQSLYKTLIRIAANLVMVGALFFGMYRASRQIALPSEAVFCLYFFGITIPAWILAYCLIRWVKNNWPAEEESLISLPGLGQTLVR